MAVELYWTTARERRRALCEDATAMARRLADQAGLAQVLVARIVATWSPATLDERLALLVELLQLAGELDNRELTFRGRLFLAVCLFEAGDVARAQEELATATRLARELRQPFWNWLTKTVETMQLLLTGSTESEESIFAAFELGQRCRQPDAPLLMAVQLCIAWWTGAGCGTPSTDEGREHFELLASGGFDLPLDWTWLTGMTLLADTCALLGDQLRADMLYDRLLPFAHQLVVVGIGQFCLGSASRSLAVLAAATRRWDDAEGHFEEALAVNERIGARTLVVRTQRAYAAMLLDRNRPDDAARARELIRQASKTTTELEMGLESARLRQLAAGADCSSCSRPTRFAHARRHHR